MANIAKLAEIYSKMTNNIEVETDAAKQKIRDEKGADFKESDLDQIDMISAQQLMAAEQMFVQMVSNVTKAEDQTKQNTIANMK